MSNAKIPLAGVIGHPVAHSLSPRLHGYWLRRFGLPGHYIPMDVAPADLETILRTLPKAGFVGVNITVPHKETVMKIADLITDRAILIGAANTLVFGENGKIRADNTDGFGFIENLRQGAPGWRPADGPGLMLGAGGAARAVISSLLDAGMREIQIANRTRARAERLVSEFGPRIKVVDWVQAGNAIEDAALVINTTSLGMTGKPDLRVPFDGFHRGQVVTDLVYSPLRTPMLMAAEAAGCTTVDGLGMLLYQAVPGFERWFGRRPEVDDQTRRHVLA
ncbi:shikimate dehydrogenase [Pseudooceanicola sp.]|uniref:shikimate dehydrogenase n=1 Tax=Pseudooceanicola sp. TaxID=1914328 RepID=UPI0026168A74|nr:shikimate dehydrogenase [Pseudooceanicola sp.]MDF1854949.1 shikimate dehydrogenase [Pseudooceanicola sp.]